MLPCAFQSALLASDRLHDTGITSLVHSGRFVIRDVAPRVSSSRLPGEWERGASTDDRTRRRPRLGRIGWRNSMYEFG